MKQNTTCEAKLFKSEDKIFGRDGPLAQWVKVQEAAASCRRGNEATQPRRGASLLRLCLRNDWSEWEKYRGSGIGAGSARQEGNRAVGFYWQYSKVLGVK